MRGFDRAYAFGFYEGKLRKLVHVFKYGGVATLARPLAGCLMTALPHDLRADMIVPVPMHWWRRYSRGYNQAYLLAREVSQRTGLPLANAVRRRHNTPPQAGLSDYERRHGLSGVFAVPRPESVRSRHVLLIDDVFTTGATASACGGVLKRAGAASITVLTLARVDRRIAVPEARSTVKSNAAGG
jgi:ComF family protein